MYFWSLSIEFKHFDGFLSRSNQFCHDDSDLDDKIGSIKRRFESDSKQILGLSWFNCQSLLGTDAGILIKVNCDLSMYREKIYFPSVSFYFFLQQDLMKKNWPTYYFDHKTRGLFNKTNIPKIIKFTLFTYIKSNF